jgi:hypothetical protein
MAKVTRNAPATIVSGSPITGTRDKSRVGEPQRARPARLRRGVGLRPNESREEGPGSGCPGRVVRDGAEMIAVRGDDDDRLRVIPEHRHERDRDVGRDGWERRRRETGGEETDAPGLPEQAFPGADVGRHAGRLPGAHPGISSYPAACQASIPPARLNTLR